MRPSLTRRGSRRAVAADGVPVSVLEMCMTANVSLSNRPYFGLITTTPFVIWSCSQLLKMVEEPLSSNCCFTDLYGCTSFVFMRITCQPNEEWTGFEISPGCICIDRIRERRRVGGRHGGAEAAGVLLDARIDRDLLRQIEEVLLRRARRRDLRVDILGLRLGLHQDVVHLHGGVVREAGLVLLPQVGVGELVRGDGALRRRRTAGSAWPGRSGRSASGDARPAACRPPSCPGWCRAARWSAAPAHRSPRCRSRPRTRRRSAPGSGS